MEVPLVRRTVTFLACLVLVSPALAGEKPAKSEHGWLDPLKYLDAGKQAVNRLKQVEFVEMATAVLKGSDMGPNDGWFRHGSQSRYGWEWLAKLHGVAPDKSIKRMDFKGPPEIFDRLDRNHDGLLKKDDFDWSPFSAYARAAMPSGYWFRWIDTNSNGRISREEWDAFFTKIAKGKNHLNPEDLREAFPVAPPPRRDDEPPPPPSSDDPSPITLIAGLLSGELGSPFPGPRVGASAPDFTLPTQDGNGEITLSQFRGKKPVVLIFGSFT
jgi:hypothetical protein